ncbi:hypothetical protein THAOC_07829 [Thalassiosira oceanica]|uniref:Uncharacterized protein n=1 Tax=Thalassiosira oceanica TaxID=159749 RepID=K0SZD6_THAOC|nr:hypothetical protein THAOC_07829 [Thalassiosira oceanica]|eukprot:EJK70785.1 hypothetical protein THAOC_07829 [Thalassiosira oceanica]
MNCSLLLGANNLKRCDRKTHDPGYFVECGDPDAEAKAKQAASDLLKELGLDDLGDLSSNTPKKGAQSAPPQARKRNAGGQEEGAKHKSQTLNLAPSNWSVLVDTLRPAYSYSTVKVAPAQMDGQGSRGESNLEKAESHKREAKAIMKLAGRDT